MFKPVDNSVLLFVSEESQYKGKAEVSNFNSCGPTWSSIRTNAMPKIPNYNGSRFGNLNMGHQAKPGYNNRKLIATSFTRKIHYTHTVRPRTANIFHTLRLPIDVHINVQSAIFSSALCYLHSRPTVITRSSVVRP